MSYRLDVNHLFLTYPQCPLDYQTAYSYLEDLFTPEKIVVSSEEHKDGTPHLHAYIKLKTRKHFTNPRFADIVLPGEPIYHGNYQSCRSFKNVCNYVIKGNIYKSNFDVTITKNNYKRSIAEDLIKEGPVACVERYPEMIFGYKRMKADYEEFKRDQEDTRLPLPNFLPNPWARVLAVKKDRKRRHYWIYSERPNFGKTTGFGLPLSGEFRGHIQAGDFTYWNLRGDEEFIILDEYNRSILKYSDLNSMCDGTFHYRIFMGGLKRLKFPLIIVLSNQSISQLYPIMNSLLEARFIEIKLI